MTVTPKVEYPKQGYFGFASSAAIVGNTPQPDSSSYNVCWHGDPQNFSASPFSQNQKGGNVGMNVGPSNVSVATQCVENIYGNVPGLYEYHHTDNYLKVTAPGTYTGAGWTVYHELFQNTMIASRGIAHVNSSVFNCWKVGDCAHDYHYATFYGGAEFYNDEGLNGFVYQLQQMGWLTSTLGTISPLSSQPGSGALQARFSSPIKCMLPKDDFSACGNPAIGFAGGVWFSDGQRIIDVGPSPTVAPKLFHLSTVAFDSVLGLVATFSDAPIAAVSTAWGTSGSCASTANENFQNYFSTTCTVRLDGSPASPGNFVITTGDSTLAVVNGPFTENVYITAVGVPKDGVQSVTFLSRHRYSGRERIMQGGPAGTCIVGGLDEHGFASKAATPTCYPIVGAYSRTQLAISNCHMGLCNSGNTQILPSGMVAIYPWAEDIGNHPSASVVDLSATVGMWSPNDVLVGTASNEYQMNAVRLLWGQYTPVDPATTSNGLLLQDVGTAPAQSAIFASTLNYGDNPHSLPAHGAFALVRGRGAYGNVLSLDFTPIAGGAVINIPSFSDPLTGQTSDGFFLFREYGVGSIGISPKTGTLSLDFNVKVGTDQSTPRIFGKALTSATVTKDGVALCETVGTGVSGGENCKNAEATYGRVTTRQVVASGATPRLIAGPAAGNGASCSTIVGANMDGVLTCKTGDLPMTNAALANIEFAGSTNVAPQGCSLMPRNAAAANATTTIYTTAPTNSGWSIEVGEVALKPSTTYAWSFSCL